MPSDFVRDAVRGVLVLALSLAPTLAGRAQSPALVTDSARTLASGTRVRVTIRDNFPPQIAGTLDSIGRQTVYFRPDGDSASQLVPLDLVTRLDVGRGMHRHALKGLVVGTSVGFLVGAVIGAGSGNESDRSAVLRASGREWAMLFGTMLGAVGGTMGTFIGFMNRSERWERVKPPYSLTLAPQRGAMRVGMRLAF